MEIELYLIQQIYTNTVDQSAFPYECFVIFLKGENCSPYASLDTSTSEFTPGLKWGLYANHPCVLRHQHVNGKFPVF